MIACFSYTALDLHADSTKAVAQSELLWAKPRGQSSLVTQRQLVSEFLWHKLLSKKLLTMLLILYYIKKKKKKKKCVSLFWLHTVVNPELD